MSKHIGTSSLSRTAAAPRRAALAATRTLKRGAIISPPPMMAARKPAYLAVKAVGSFVPKLTQKSFEKYGFSTATLLTDWARIIGEDLARDTRPERLQWPRGAANSEAGETGQGGATLILRVDPARALDVSYKERQIIERINTYFGYRAIAAMRLIQAPVTDTAAHRETRRMEAPALPPLAGAEVGDALSQALARMEAGVLARSQVRRT